MKKIWYNYCISGIDPQEIDSIITEDYIIIEKMKGKRIHLDIYSDKTKSINGDNSANIKKTIIFIHGTGVYSRFYAEFLYGFFKNGYNVVAMDLPGHGSSEGKRGHFNMSELVMAVEHVTDYVIKRYSKNIIVIGSSLGGITALYSVANDPRIKAAICMNAALFNEKAHKEIVKVKGFMKIIKPLVPFFAKIIPTLKISIFTYLNPRDLVSDVKSLEIVDILLKDPQFVDKYTLKSLAAQMNEAPVRPIEEITTPIMLINGSDDILFSIDYITKIFNRLKKSKNKKLEIIQGPHLIFHEKRDESLQKILFWLETIF